METFQIFQKTTLDFHARLSRYIHISQSFGPLCLNRKKVLWVKKKNHKNHGQDKIYIHQNMMSWSEDTEDQIH